MSVTSYTATCRSQTHVSILDLLHTRTGARARTGAGTQARTHMHAHARAHARTHARARTLSSPLRTLGCCPKCITYSHCCWKVVGEVTVDDTGRRIGKPFESTRQRHCTHVSMNVIVDIHTSTAKGPAAAGRVTKGRFFGDDYIIEIVAFTNGLEFNHRRCLCYLPMSKWQLLMTCTTSISFQFVTNARWWRVVEWW